MGLLFIATCARQTGKPGFPAACRLWKASDGCGKGKLRGGKYLFSYLMPFKYGPCLFLLVQIVSSNNVCKDVWDVEDLGEETDALVQACFYFFSWGTHEKRLDPSSESLCLTSSSCAGRWVWRAFTKNDIKTSRKRMKRGLRYDLACMKAWTGFFLLLQWRSMCCWNSCNPVCARPYSLIFSCFDLERALRRSIQKLVLTLEMSKKTEPTRSGKRRQGKENVPWNVRRSSVENYIALL